MHPLNLREPLVSPRPRRRSATASVLALLALGWTGGCHYLSDEEYAALFSKGDGADGADGSGADADGDGYDAPEDCDDTDAAIHPGADEHCDGVDEDCTTVANTPPWTA